jgi:serine/threonine-protein kinase RsbW
MNRSEVPWSRLNFEIESRLEAVPLLGQVALLLCTAAGFAPLEGNQLEVCVVEAVNNSILHAYHGDSCRRVELEVTLSSDRLIFDVWDSGTSGDPGKINADHRADLEFSLDTVDGMSESGRGLGIIQEIMDSSEYTPGKERNRFRMIKRRNFDEPSMPQSSVAVSCQAIPETRSTKDETSAH